MIKLYGDYHTHTTYSHGTGSILDNVMAAKARGLTEIAITDHGISHFRFGVKKEKIPEMREEIHRINELGLGIKVMLGLECNVIGMNGEIDLPEDVLKYMDIVLLGYHLMAKPSSISNAYNVSVKNYLVRGLHFNYEKVKEENTINMIKAIQQYPVNVITHPNARMPMDTYELAKEAVKRQVALEINCKGGKMTKEEIQKAKPTGVSFIINSDGHSPEAVGVFDKGILLAEEAGLDHTTIINANR